MNHETIPITRRRFLQATALSSVAAPALASLSAAPSGKPPANTAGQPETLAATLYRNLPEPLRRRVCFPFEHKLRSAVDNNWDITDVYVDDFPRDQQALLRELFLSLHSPDYADAVLRQVEHDAGDEGISACSVAFFGEPGTGKFEFVLTGRHVTRRCDGDSVEGAAFGGPIFYGHQAVNGTEAPDHPGNVYWYQAKRANQVYQMLSGAQRRDALLKKVRSERGTKTVKLTGKTVGLPGLRFSDLSSDQKDLAQDVISDVLAPFREADREESMTLIRKAGLENLHMAFYREDDIGNDGVWDMWQIEGPSMLMLFRGAPHVHAWIHVRDDKSLEA